MIASGGISGGFSSMIAGGNFMDGFRQGLITSGLNHLGSRIENSAYADGDEGSKSGNNKESQYGDVFNFFDKNNSDDDYILWKYADRQVSNGPEKNVVTIYSHGSAETVNQMKANTLHQYLLKHSPTYLDSYKNHYPIDLKIRACFTGRGLSKQLSSINPYARVHGATHYWEIRSFTSLFIWQNGVANGGDFVIYQNGIKIRSYK